MPLMVHFEHFKPYRRTCASHQLLRCFSWIIFSPPPGKMRPRVRMPSAYSIEMGLARLCPENVRPVPVHSNLSCVRGSAIENGSLRSRWSRVLLNLAHAFKIECQHALLLVGAGLPDRNCVTTAISNATIDFRFQFAPRMDYDQHFSLGSYARDSSSFVFNNIYFLISQ